MTLILTGAPEAEPVTLTDARSFLRLQGTADDELLSGLITAARQDIERASARISRRERQNVMTRQRTASA